MRLSKEPVEQMCYVVVVCRSLCCVFVSTVGTWSAPVPVYGTSVVGENFSQCCTTASLESLARIQIAIRDRTPVRCLSRSKRAGGVVWTKVPGFNLALVGTSVTRTSSGKHILAARNLSCPPEASCCERDTIAALPLGAQSATEVV